MLQEQANRVYQSLGRLIEEMPAIRSGAPFTSEQLQWLGRAYALIHRVDAQDAKEFKTLTDRMSVAYASRDGAWRSAQAILFRALAVAEESAPTASKGAFIPVGNAFDVASEMSKIFGGARNDLLLVDPYMDEGALIEFAVLADEGVAIRLLTDAGSYKPGLPPTASRFADQYKEKRPLQLRMSPKRTLHDRIILIDGGAHVYLVTQSFNAIAARSPASIVRVDPETARLKADAYEALWKAATVVV
ncbi:MAG TPA: phosphatidylserine/phosphatidylglycerophosphate/cardiolipin synthase family protein [Rhodoblastus sp.]|nr:phosphatidylserine/phosphatidylglycerophosphate/cardiolipin synthase family protein [Rhodoblastus sp.]